MIEIENRITFNELFLKILNLISKRSSCKKYKVACLVIDEDFKNIISFGYNGVPSGQQHCLDISNECNHFGEVEIHAEINAMAKVNNFLKHELSLWCTHKPCLNCAKSIIANKNTLKIERIYYIYDFQDKLCTEFNIDINRFFKDNGINLINIDPKIYEELIQKY